MHGPADRRAGERRDYSDDWTRDSVRMFGALRSVARLLIGWHEAAEVSAARINAEAKRAGHDFDRRADTMDGAAGAYSVTMSALIGALRVASIDEIAGSRETWQQRPMQRPVLPSELTEAAFIDALTDATEPDDADDLGAGDHFAGMPR